MIFHIISTGWHCEKYVKACIKSCLEQDQDFKAYFVSDGCNNTSIALTQAPNDERLMYFSRNKENIGAAYRRHEILNLIKPDDEDVIVLLGLDDRLLSGALSEIKKKYDNGAWMTYGNWVDNKSEMLPEGFLEFSNLTHQRRDYRKVKYRSTAPNTFKYKLYKKIRESDFIYNGEWLNATTESPIMFACLEMCGRDRIGIIEKPIYVYNRRTESNLKRFGRDYKYAIYYWVIQLPKYDLWKK